MSAVEEYIAASDNANDYADSLTAGLEQRALEDMDDLFTATERRDEGLWTEMGVSPELVLADYDEVERDERDLDWSLGLAGISAASLHQFVIDNREDTIIKPTAYRMMVVGGLAAGMTRNQLVAAGKRGVEVEGVKEFARLQAKYTKGLAPLKAMNDKELYGALTEIGAMRPAQKTIADSMGYVSRMTNYKPRSPQFKSEVANLIDSNSKRGLVGMNRRAVERLYTVQAIGGDTEKLMVWVVEGGKNTCGFCLDRAGSVMTYEEWSNQGMPGADVCKGGDMCRCHLEVV